MGLFKSGNDERRWSRRLVDDETRDFLAHHLEETSEMFRTASGEFQLRGLCLDAFASGQTTDLRWLKNRGVDPEEFYRRELAPSWHGIEQAERARRLDAFIELSNMLGEGAGDGEPSDEYIDLVATVHVKVLLLAWAYDRTYGYVDRLLNGPLQYRNHRFRLTAGRLRGRGRPSQNGH